MPSARALAGRFVALTALVALVAFSATGAPASAAQLVISPVSIEMPAGARSATIELTNRADDPLRLQVAPLGWDMDASGNAPESTTGDIVAYPQFVTIAPHETRRIRAATLVAERGSSERAYRLSLTEIPAFDGPSTKPGVNLIFRTKYLLGVYLEPATANHDAEITNAAVRGGHVTFSIADRGNVHEVLKGLTITGLAGAAHSAFTKSIDATIVLAGRTRTFDVPLDAGQCAATRAVSISLTTSAQTLAKTIDVAGGDCAP